MAVSKTKPNEAILEAYHAGQKAFGENYVQEGVDKIQYFEAQNIQLEWHFIGPLQSNKTRLVAEHFDWMQTLERAKIADRLNEQRPTNKAPLNVLIQINISDEASKSGIQPSEMIELAKHIENLPHFPQPDGSVKLAAGWLIDQCHLKGFQIGGAAVHQQQALVLINKGNATGQDIVKLAHHIRQTVADKFGVYLQPEVRFMGAKGEVN